MAPFSFSHLPPDPGQPITPSENFFANASVPIAPWPSAAVAVVEFLGERLEALASICIAPPGISGKSMTLPSQGYFQFGKGQVLSAARESTLSENRALTLMQLNGLDLLGVRENLLCSLQQSTRFFLFALLSIALD